MMETWLARNGCTGDKVNCVLVSARNEVEAFAKAAEAFATDWGEADTPEKRAQKAKECSITSVMTIRG